MDFKRQLVKQCGGVLGEDARVRRKQSIQTARLEKRFQDLEKRRCLDENGQQTEEDKKKKKSRAQMLQEWKEMKQKKLEEVKKVQKPIFKVPGFIRYNPDGYLALNSLNNQPQPQPQPEKKTKNNYPEKIIQTRSMTRINNLGAKNKLTERCVNKENKQKTEKIKTVKPKGKPKEKLVNIQKGLAAVIDNACVPINEHQFKAPANIKAFDLTMPYSPKITKSTRKAKSFWFEQNESAVKKVLEKRSSVFENIQKRSSVFGRLTIPYSPKITKSVRKTRGMSNKVINKENSIENLSGFSKMGINEIVKEPEAIKDDIFTHISNSPFVTTTRGSTGGRGSAKKQKKSMTSLERIEFEMDEEQKQILAKISSFRKMVNDEKQDLNDKCEKWRKISEDCSNIPADVEGDINVVIGKTQMLTSDKCEQFIKLIKDFEDGDSKIKLDDLQGFWDWVCLDIDQMHANFGKLEDLKQNNWKEVEVKVTVPLKEVKVKKVVPVKKVQTKPAVSGMKELIRAAREKALREAKEKQQAEAAGLNSLKEEDTKIFDGIFFKIESPVATPTPKQFTPILKQKRSTLRNSVLHSALQCSTIMSATRKAKELNPDDSKTESELTISFINCDVTPAKGILKTPASGNARQSTSKSVGFKLAQVNRISEKYFMPNVSQTSEESSCDEINFLPTPTPEKKRKKEVTPLRRSSRRLRAKSLLNSFNN